MVLAKLNELDYGFFSHPPYSTALSPVTTTPDMEIGGRQTMLSMAHKAVVATSSNVLSQFLP